MITGLLRYVDSFKASSWHFVAYSIFSAITNLKGYVGFVMCTSQSIHNPARRLVNRFLLGPV